MVVVRVWLARRVVSSMRKFILRAVVTGLDLNELFLREKVMGW
jgi:hypothetical protein